MFDINSKKELEDFITKNWINVNRYIDRLQEGIPVPVYSSVDIRESKNKIAPIDNNLYPAGFNNVCNLDLDAATSILRKTLKEINSSCKTIGILIESHTKNTFYLDHLAILGRTIRNSGFDTIFLSLDPELFSSELSSLDLISHSKYNLSIEKASIVEDQIKSLHSPSVNIDIVLLNNDQSNPIKIDWKNITTPIVPTPELGWYRRNKTDHFKFYNNVTNIFCDQFSINPELIRARYKSLDNIDFSTKEGLDQLSKSVDLLKESLPESSKIFIKAAQGTYGMGIHVVSSGSDVINMNRKIRNKMDVGKNRIKFTSVLIQEGIETILKYDDKPAEIAIYLVDGVSIGGFMRVNPEKTSQSNLNSRGMIFRKFCISEIRQNQDHKSKEALYSIIARLSTLASGYEIKEDSTC